MPSRAARIGGRVVQVADDQPTFWDRVAAGRWEPDTLAVIDEIVDDRTTFVDLGAWVGPTALYAAAIARRVVAVEADPAALDQLRRNLAANPELAARVEVVPRAVHARDGHVTLGARRKPGDSMSSTLLGDAGRTWQAATLTPGAARGDALRRRTHRRQDRHRGRRIRSLAVPRAAPRAHRSRPGLVPPQDARGRDVPTSARRPAAPALPSPPWPASARGRSMRRARGMRGSRRFC